MPAAKLKSISAYCKSYCETTTVHGFAYWVNAPKIIERVFWVAVVLSFGSYAGFIIGSAIQDWTENPTATFIKTYSKVIV